MSEREPLLAHDGEEEEERNREEERQRLLRPINQREEPEIDREIEEKLLREEPQAQQEEVNADANSPSEQPSTPNEGEKKVGSVSLATLLFSFASWQEKLMMFFGTLAAVVTGALVPANMFLFGRAIGNFISYNGRDPDAFMDSALTISLRYLILALCSLLTCYVQMCFWMWNGERQAWKIRVSYFKVILRQDIGWYDTNPTAELTTKVTSDTLKIQEALSEKVSQVIQSFASFIAAYVIAFYEGWKLTLVLISVAPLLMFCAALLGFLMKNLTSKSQAAYAKAGSVAEEVFVSIRTVASFSGELKEILRYFGNLQNAKITGVYKSLTGATSLGVTFFIIYCTYGLAFWYGGVLFTDGQMEAANVLTVFFCVIIGSFALGSASPGITAILEGKAIAYELHELLKRKPPIDNQSPEGLKGSQLSGQVEFKDVFFHYPSRAETPVLRGLNLKVDPGKTVALVGASGCGKSTVVALIERFYDAISGEVCIDGRNVKDYNISWLREHIGIVGQEPTLFNMTIKENIALGKSEETTMEEIIQVSKQANIYDFIMSLPLKYDTIVGERGVQMSGGQKQRIAIARALIRSPKILLLDEATSALDYESEGIVQDALDKASQGRTTILIAHRLSTVQNADEIIVFLEGKDVERGTHDQLMKLNGHYYNLVKAQITKTEEAEEEERLVGGVQQKTSSSDLLRKAVGSPSTDKLLSTSAPYVSSETALSPAQDEKKKEMYPVKYSRVVALNKPDFIYLFFGLIAAGVNGGTMPVFSIIFSKINAVFLLQGSEFDDQSRFWSLMFIVLGGGAGLSMFFQSLFFGIAGERLTMRLRNMCFTAMIKQQIGWFDKKENSTGALTTRLENDTSLFKGLFGTNLGLALQAMVSMVTGLTIAFVSGWKLTLIILGCVPFVILANLLNFDRMKGFSEHSRLAYENSGKIASESISNIRTVASLNRERQFLRIFVDSLQEPYVMGMKRSQLSGISFGFSQFFLFCTNALGFYAGAYLVKEGQMDFESMLRVFTSITFCSMAVGQASALAPDYAKAESAASNIFKTLDEIPSIDSLSTEGLKPNQMRGEIEFKDVIFRYPSRPDVPVLNGLSLTIPPGKSYALVGSSGCGKSTCIGLLERFYDPLEGSILIDGIPLKDLNIAWTRNQIGLVGQEPVLFNTTIKENILYGIDQQKTQVTMEDVIHAAKQANIHNFISRLPKGYDTPISQSKLSGGQKQRVAIARAIIRNPKILLLDEATSALDAESEAIVQNALDRVRRGRTTIIIAHRLTTIANADCICVVRKGVIVEMGKHEELLARQGIYTKLWNSANH